MHHEKQELSAILLQLSTLSLLSNSAPVSDVCNSHSPIHPSERRNDLYKYVINNFLQKVTNYTKVFYRVYYTQKCHKNYLHLSFLSPYPVSQVDVFGHEGDSRCGWHTD